MGIKEDLQKKGLELMGDPRVARLMQDERFMKAMMSAMAVPGRVNAFTTEQTERFARNLRLPTLVQHRELERQLKNLEAEVSRLKKKLDER